MAYLGDLSTKKLARRTLCIWWQEQAYHFHLAEVFFRTDANMHASIFRFSSWKINGNFDSAMLRLDHKLLMPIGMDYHLDHTVDWSAVLIVATFPGYQ
jgi:hypothetical protein